MCKWCETHTPYVHTFNHHRDKELLLTGAKPSEVTPAPTHFCEVLANLPISKRYINFHYNTEILQKRKRRYFTKIHKLHLKFKLLWRWGKLYENRKIFKFGWNVNWKWDISSWNRYFNRIEGVLVKNYSWQSETKQTAKMEW